MPDRDKKEIARNNLVNFYNLMEQPKDMRWVGREAGYRYLKITVEDVDCKEQVFQSVYTMRKENDLEQLFEDILNLASWPKDIQDNIETAFFMSHPGQPEMETVIEQGASVWQVLKRQLFGGRKKQRGLSPKTEEKYSHLTKEFWPFWKRGGTEEQYAKRKGISVKTLQRALKYDKEASKKG
jgi:cell fate (sporulation/competence/biofilm development) regulator YlbF (YheA/YmcA/DUF963 family)